MNFLRDKIKSLFLLTVLFTLFCLLPETIVAQNPKLKNIKSIRVGTKNDIMVNIMFTTATEEYFYAILKDVKIKKTLISKIETKIRKSDSVSVEVTIVTNTAKQSKKLLKQVTKEFGKAENKVYKSPTTFDWLWDEKRFPYYIESKSLHYIDSDKAEFKILLIPQ